MRGPVDEPQIQLAWRPGGLAIDGEGAENATIPGKERRRPDRTDPAGAGRLPEGLICRIDAEVRDDDLLAAGHGGGPRGRPRHRRWERGGRSAALHRGVVARRGPPGV